MYVCANFLPNWTTLTFSVQTCPKMDIGLVIQKNYCQNKNQHPRYVCQFLVKMYDFEFFGPNLSKKDFRVGMGEKRCRNKNQHCRDTLCTNFQPNWITLTFLALICPKMDLGLDIQKTNFGIRIGIVKMSCVPIFRKNIQLWLFRPKFAEKWVLRLEFQNSKSGFRICTSKTPCVSILS